MTPRDRGLRQHIVKIGGSRLSAPALAVTGDDVVAQRAHAGSGRAERYENDVLVETIDAAVAHRLGPEGGDLVDV